MPVPGRAVGAALLGTGAAPVGGLLALLLLADIALIGLHLSLKIFGEPSGYTFDLGVDRGYGELVQYLKSLWAGALAALLAVRRRAAVLAAWALVCGYLLADDWFQLHERFGAAFAERVPALGSLANDVGELVWTGGVGLVLLTVVAVTHVRAAARDRAVPAVLVVLFGVLVLLGIVLDAVHHTILEIPAFDVPLTTLEDGGELVALSVIVTFLFAVAFTGHEPVLGRRLSFLARGRADHAARTAP